MTAAAVTGSYRLAADIGGTFTDLVLVEPDGRYRVEKVSSTPEDYSRGVAEGGSRMLARSDLEPAELAEVVHGTTVASNTVLQNAGATTALITTRGFRDVLELRRLRVPEQYNLFYTPPAPLVERRLRLEVEERLDAEGGVVVELDEQSIHEAVDRISVSGASAVAVSLIHSYRNPAHEQAVARIVEARLPEVFLSLSSEVLPEIREYERTSTTVINAYLGPVIRGYLESLLRRLEDGGVSAPVRIMQSNGGVMSLARAAERPVLIIESGPAAGVVAAHQAATRMGLRDLITFDMGGTSAKAALIEDGHPSRTTEHEVGAGISLSSRLVKGGGHAVKVPVMDLAEVGAGGGSIVWFDKGGALKVGPQSAGAVPGPVCYGLGGEKPTVTDANLVLGFLNPDRLAGGDVRLYPDLARTAVEEQVADRLGVSLHEAAHGIHTVANATMIRAIRAVSTYRGRDPRDFTLFAFGGNGPMMAAGIAGSLSMKRVVVPPAPGVFSAVGLLEAKSEHSFVQTFFAPLGEVDPSALNDVYAAVEERAIAALVADGYSVGDIAWDRSADLRYVGQAYELTVGVSAGALTKSDMATLAKAFHAEHLRTHGHEAPAELIEIVNVRLTAEGRRSRTTPVKPARADNGAPVAPREVFFGPRHGLHTTPILRRGDLDRTETAGPVIIEEYDSTTVVPPGSTARRDEHDNIVIDVE